MPGRKRYDALSQAVGAVQLPTFVAKDGEFIVDPSYTDDAWRTLQAEAGDIEDKAKSLQDHPHLHDSHKALADDLVTAATSFDGMVTTAHDEWLALPKGYDVKQTESMVGLGNVLQFMRGKLGEFDQGKLDAVTAAFGS